MKWIKMFSKGIFDCKNIFPIRSAKCPSRSSHWRCSIKKAVLKKFTIFIGKDLCWSVSCEHCEIFKNTCFEEHLRTALSAHLTVKAYLEPYQTSTMNLFYENSYQVKAVNLFWKKTLLLISGRVLNTPFDSHNTCHEHTFRFTINCWCHNDVSQHS